jgi:nickel transport protein
MTPAWLFAHAMALEAKLKGDKVVITVFYDDDTPADNAKMIVEDESNAVIAEGKTDDKGMWTFATPKPGRYLVKADAGAGHAAKTTVVIPAGMPEPASTDTSGREIAVSEGANRDSFTGSDKWRNAGIGSGAIVSIGVLGWFFLRRKRLQENRTV